MEVFQPTPILPSRAPRWADVEEVSARVLREQSGNRQIAYSHSQPFSHEYTVNDEGNDGFQFGLQGHSKSYRSIPSNGGIYSGQIVKPREHRNNRHSSYRTRRKGESDAGKDERDIRRLEQTARHLAILFARCDGYIKYRNRQPKQGTKDDQKWPDHMEDAFLRGQSRKPTALSLSLTDAYGSARSLAPSWTT